MIGSIRQKLLHSFTLWALCGAAVLCAAETAPTPRPATVPTTAPTTRPATLPAGPVGKLPAKASKLFIENKVWNVHLKFTADQWAALEPTRIARPPAGGNRAMQNSPAIMAPMLIKQGDLNADGKLSKDELLKVANSWFTQWDKDAIGKLSAEQLGNGLNMTLGAAAVAQRGLRLLAEPGQRNGLASSMGIEFNYVHADLEFEGHAIKDVAVRYKGNGTYMQSQNTYKKSFKIDLNKHNPQNEIGGVTTLNLQNCVTDAGYMNEVLSHRLYRSAGLAGPRTAYAKVFISVPGKFDQKYFGVYSLVENIDSHFATENFNSKKGAIFKPVTPNLFAYLGDDFEAYKQTYDPKTDLTPAQERRLIELCKLVTDADDKVFNERIAGIVDFDEVAKYMAVTVWLSTLDSILMLGQNFYVYLDHKSQKFRIVPWDLDHSFGQFQMGGSQELRENLSIHKPWRGEHRFLERLFKNPEFKAIYISRFKEFSGSIFQPDRFAKQIDELALALREPVGQETSDHLTRFEKMVSGEGVAPARQGIIGLFAPVAKPIRTFVIARTQSVIDQLAGKMPGQTLPEGGFGGRGRNVGIGTMLAPGVLNALDANHDAVVSIDEWSDGFGKGFGRWNVDQSGALTLEQLQAGLMKDLTATRPPERDGGRNRPGRFIN